MRLCWHQWIGTADREILAEDGPALVRMAEVRAVCEKCGKTVQLPENLIRLNRINYERRAETVSGSAEAQAWWPV